jgi:hypothetical protein
VATTNSLRKYGYDKYERFILITSKIIEEENPFLHQFLLKHEQLSVKDNVPSNHPLHDYFDRTTGLLTRLVAVAKEEWATVHENGVPKIFEDDTGTRQCNLCGHKHLKYIFFIYHPERNIEIEVGSECIRAFDIALNGTFGEARDKLLDAARRQIKLVGKDVEIEQLTNKGISRFRQAQAILKTKPYYPPNPHFLNIIKTEASITSLIRRFKKDIQQATEQNLQYYNEFLCNYENDINSIDKLVKEASGIHLVSQEAVQWLVSNKQREALLNKVLLHGCICHENIHHIKEPKHIEKYLKEIQAKCASDEFLYHSKSSQSAHVELHTKKGEYVFKLNSAEIILEAAKNGFPDRADTLNINMKQLLFDKNAEFLPDKADGERAISTLFSKAGYSVLENNFSANKSLIQRGNMGSIIDISKYTNVIGRAILSNEDRLATEHIRKSQISLVNLKDAKSDWHELYE